MTIAPRDLARLAKFVRTRRLERYPSRLAAAKAAGVSKDTWKRVEEGLVVREGTYAAMDPALGWAVGSCMAIAEGGEPVPVEYSEEGGGTFTIPRSWLPEEAGAAVRDAVRDSAMETTSNLTVRELHALSDRVVEELRKLGILPNPD
ncbi:helix-turn-helix domain-containing protein [Streptomyces sp. NBC_01352]|uniref:helix-turn-helix domain-containing protein n=1 Tax=Streptomyces sp. NBC_01352 TaxID=2903834 RepID=UPI002E37BB42|nr:helix-turn-helix transcriptional regulator [Streptomyces sp. NBC_01352]